MATPLPPQRGLPASAPDVARVLDQFRAAGLIAWDADAPAIRRLRPPSAPEIAAALRPDALFS